jgi:hypothetical protein
METHQMNEPMECSACGEIELRHTRTDNGIITYECRCGHEENQLGHWSQQLDDDEAAIQEFCVF